MSEIKRDLIKLDDGQIHKSTGNEYVITENHTIADVLRWLLSQNSGDKSELKFIIDGFE